MGSNILIIKSGRPAKKCYFLLVGLGDKIPGRFHYYQLHWSGKPSQCRFYVVKCSSTQPRFGRGP